MTQDETFDLICLLIRDTLGDKGFPVPMITDQSNVLGDELGMDSLDLAVLVTELETRLGFDPFAQGFIEFKTVGELAKLYAK
jgi:acyl carrier protein